MRLIACTSALPRASATEAISTLAGMGFVGIEVPCGPGEALDPTHDRAEALALANHAREAGAPILSVVVHIDGLAASDGAVSAAAREELYAAMGLTSAMRAHFVRLAALPMSPEVDRAATLRRLTRALMIAAMHGLSQRVTLLLAAQEESLVSSSAALARVIDDVAFPGVSAVVDPADLVWTMREPWQRSLVTLGQRIAYVQLRDYTLRDDRRVACPIGEGLVPWESILPVLDWLGVGYACVDYGQGTEAELVPPATTGLPQSLAFCQAALELGVCSH
ncbi:MAG: TIM barrel protein [Anaerolineales bacterium]